MKSIHFYNTQLWPANELEHIDSCPYCGSSDREAVEDDVRDWYYRSSDQSWSYWNCKICSSLFLDPRPAAIFIGKAYTNYYTHDSKLGGWRDAIKQRLRNECYSQWLNANLGPRLHVPRLMSDIFDSLRNKIQIPFGLDIICSVSPGRILDVGCGSGRILSLARQAGWESTGIEFDPAAVIAARKDGLNVIEGDYRAVATLSQRYDLVICSHVIEHVDNPRLLLEMLGDMVAEGGILALSFPNAQSHLRKRYRGFWRGYEAPRHLSIPAANWIDRWLRERFAHVVRAKQKFDTSGESKALLASINPADDLNFDEGQHVSNENDNADLAGFVCSSHPLPPILT
jgi:2-polyprenyl-3-methyl-5-hydroxy-6-metoxy-1,4-benzoquinol methylase